MWTWRSLGAVPAVALGVALLGGTVLAQTGATAGGSVGATVQAGASIGAGAGAGSSAQAAATVQVATNAKLGRILVDANGMTLYVFAKDKPGVSACTGACVKLWPPLAAGGSVTLASGLPGTLSVIRRSDGTSQIAYNGWPLYRYAGDQRPGETNGQGFRNIWFAAVPTARTGMPAAGGPQATASLPKTGAPSADTPVGLAMLIFGLALAVAGWRRRTSA
jgi:predicted lipoprotein with Yx(FWY)xxD motif